MRILTYLILLLPGLLSAGCTKEGTSGCPTGENLILSFGYTDRQGKDLFDEAIDNLAVYLFDEKGYFHSLYPLTRASGHNLRRLPLLLEPGEYQVVCWANLADPDQATEMDSKVRLEDSYILQPDEYPQRLFYGPADGTPAETLRRFTIRDDAPVEKQIELMKAYREVYVLVKGGFDSGDAQESPLRVGLCNLPGGYDFSMKSYPQSKEYTLPARRQSPGEYLAEFHTPFFGIDGQKELRLYRPAEETPFYTLNLYALYQSKGAFPKPDETIYIEIAFVDGNVIIDLGGWGDGNVEPGWDD